MLKNITFLLSRLTATQDWLWCITITCLGAIVRLHNYGLFPPDNWTSDEYAFAWSGMSLIQDHFPTSWSWLSPYQDSPVVVWEEKMTRYQLVSPWFDHPPLFGLIVGMTAILGGAKEFFDCTISIIRIPSLVFGIISITLIYILAKKLFNGSVALITSLIFATHPNLVLLSRLAVSENLLLLLVLIFLICCLEYQKTENKKYFYWAAILGGITPLIKVTGLFIAAALFVWLTYQKKILDSLIALLIGVMGFSLYYLYGWIYDFELFKLLIQAQSERFLDFGVLRYLAWPSLVLPNLFVEDAWWVISWFTLPIFLQSQLEKFKINLIALPLLIYSLLLVCTGGQSHFYAWYLIPFYPLLFLILGKFLDDFHNNPSFLTACLLFLYLMVWYVEMNIGDWLLSGHNGKSYFILSTGLILAVYWLDDLTERKTKPLTTLVSWLLFGTLIIGNINLVLTFKM
jgi:4-amino-4-deoxy-L-arabinose transferase-like glycosyltransferase